MKRSYELLIADKMQTTGVFSFINDAIKHIDKQWYSARSIFTKSNRYTIVTVIFSEKTFIVYQIDEVDESVKTLINNLESKK